MNIFIDDDDDDIVVEPQKEECGVKELAKLALEDLQDIISLLEKLAEKIDCFGGMSKEEIEEKIIFYSEIIPAILLGNFEDILGEEVDDSYDIAELSLKKMRKDIFEKLANKYN